ncbi:MAG: hypothetical protein JSV84_17380 [Gemmatimonadota bacterium]|nr:MAG: hypothetical protein JSV84_17380 [Gemmatimonadota bacterium]
MTRKRDKNHPAPRDSSDPRGASQRSKVLQHLPFIAALLVISLGLRVLPYYAMTFTGGDPVIRDPDACYHLRRAELIMHSFPDIPVFDSYMNHPFGAYIIWPPLYDLLLTGVWGFLSLFPGHTSPPGGLLFLPLLLFCATALVVYTMGLRFWPGKRWNAFLAACAPAVLPIVIHYSYVGQLDHHAAELLYVALFVASLMKSLPTIRRKKNFQWNWTLPGICLGLGLLVQHGLLLLEGVFLLSLLPFAGKTTRSHLWAFGVAVNGTGFLTTLPFGLFYHLRGVPLAHTHYGLFQSMVLLVMSLFFFTLWLSGASHPKFPRYAKYASCAATATLTVVLTLFLLKQIFIGTTYLLRTWTGWQAQIAESHSLLRTSWDRAFDELGQYMSWAILLLPIVWIVMVSRWSRLNAHEKILFVVTIIFAAFGLFQVRFLPYLAILYGLMLVSLINWTYKKLPFQWLVIPLLVAGLLVSYYPCTKSFGGQDITSAVYRETKPILQYLKENRPSDALSLRSHAPPDYGVLSDWNLGHYIKYYGKWPVLADNFGEHATDLSRLNRFFFSTENTDAYRFLDENRVRYILCQDLPSMYQSMILDKSMLAYVSDFDPNTGRIVFAPRMFPTVLYRLVWRYGGSFIDVQNQVYYPPLARLRLVAESRGRDETLSEPNVARIKLFEYVRGARIEVTRLPPHTEVILSTNIHTPHGRTFPYIQFLKSNEDGRVFFVLPYSNEGEQNTFADEYKLVMGDQDQALPLLTEQMILEGRIVQKAWE